MTQALAAFERSIQRAGAEIDGLWSRIAALQRDDRPLRVLFLAAEHGAGTTTLAAAAALGLARNLHAATTLVELDVEHPGLASRLGLAGSPGLSEVLDGRVPIAEACTPVPGCPDLLVLPAGASRASVRGELASHLAQSAFSALERQAKFVVFDSPPLPASAATRVIASHADVAVLVVRARSTELAAAREATAVLTNARVPLLGAVLNRWITDAPFARRAAV